MAGAFVAANSLAPAQVLTVRREAGGTTVSQQTGTLVTNDFNLSATGAYTTSTALGVTLGVNTGTYTAAGNGFGVFNDQYGGSGTGGATGSGPRTNYFSTGGRSSPADANTFLNGTATLSLSSTAYYFGLYWSAVDSSNRLEFYKTGAGPGGADALIDTLTAGQLNAGLAGTAYDGNNAGQVTGEKYAFINIYANTSAQGFDKIVFSNATAGSGFESDTHTFAFSLIADGDQSGILIPVPEPAGLLIVAGGLLALGRRVRRWGVS